MAKGKIWSKLFYVKVSHLGYTYIIIHKGPCCCLVIYLPEWLTSFFIASREIACPQDKRTGGFESEKEYN